MQVEDGNVRFTLKIDGEEKPFEADSLVATTIADQLVAKHKLGTKPVEGGETYEFTPEFYADIGNAFGAAFKLPTTSSQIAMKVWLAAQREVYGLKKKHERAARVARAYGINPFGAGLSRGQEIGLLAILPKLEAQELCKSGNYDDSEPEKVLELWRFAFEDDNLAQAKATEAAKRLIERETRKRG